MPAIEHRPGPTAQRIVEALAEAIRDGRLKTGAQLPPHRELADRMRVSVGTVSRAYSLAKERGLITGIVGRGTFVAAGGDEPEGPGREIDLTQNFIRWDPGESVTELLRTAIRDRTDLRMLMEVYPDPAGRLEHRQSAARWLARRGLAASEQQIVLTNGAQHALFTVFAALTRPGDWIAAEHLTYPGIKAIASQLELRVAGLPMDREGLLPEALDRLCATEKIRILYTIPTLQNPTGALMSEDRRETIADIARRRNILIVEDDIYAFLVESPPPPMAAFAPERCYLVTGLSKGMFPGLRLGFAVTPPGGRDAVAAMVRMSLLTVSPLAAAIGTNWLEDRTVDRIAEWKRMEVEWRWQMASRFFDLDTHDAHFAAHLWLPLTQDPEQFVSRVRANGVLLAAADVFSVNAESVPSAVRICLGVPATRARLQQALEAIADVLRGRPAMAPFI